MIIIGIDPGKNGGIATDVHGAVSVKVMPEIHGFVDYIKRTMELVRKDRIYVYVEKSQSMPKQGVSSAFNYGRHFGELLGVLYSFDVPHVLVPPQTWTRIVHVGTKDGRAKDRSLEAARRLFPTVNLMATPRCKREHDGIVDALLILDYGRRSIKHG